MSSSSLVIGDWTINLTYLLERGEFFSLSIDNHVFVAFTHDKIFSQFLNIKLFIVEANDSFAFRIDDTEPTVCHGYKIPSAYVEEHGILRLNGHIAIIIQHAP